MVRKQQIWLFSLSIVLLTVGGTRALVMTQDKGSWPAQWPKTLDPLRTSARTIEVANGTQENVYEITFSDRETFEKMWPTILAIKTHGAPLTLYKMTAETPKSLLPFFNNTAPIVRIYGPPEGSTSDASGKSLKAGAPWPKELYGPNGELPEYVQSGKVDGKMAWVDVEKVKGGSLGFHNRARVDIELVVDGKVIDLNCIAIPGDTPVVDKRF